MSADRQVNEVRDEADGLERRGDDMEERLDELESDIADAKKTAAQRQDAPENALMAEGEGTVGAGDWEGESSGSQQGEDAEDTEGEQRGAGAHGEAEQAD